MIEYFKEYLNIKDVEYKINQKLSKISPIKIGGYAKIIVLPKNKTELIEVLNFVCENNISFKMLGNMSNVLPRDNEYTKVIIKTDKLTEIGIQGNLFECDCGVALPLLSRFFAESGVSGLEELSGIPGRLGGAVYGNAGAFGREISELIAECRVYEKSTGKIGNLESSDIEFAYRYSSFLEKEFVILSVLLKGTPAARRDILYHSEEIRKIRKNTQPIGEASLGSTFKRPLPGVSAGKLIDECGLRGFSVNGAKISQKHAGFIVNCGGATSEDVKTLIEIARNSVKQKFGIHLECEIEFL